MTHDNANTTETLQSIGLDPQKMPAHIAIIMDGNGRWAKKRLLPRQAGHKQGAEALRRILKACAELGVAHLSVYAFSTENWKRPDQEVSFLMGLFSYLIHKETPELNKQGVRVKVLGDIKALSDELQANIKKIEQTTKQNTRIQLNILMNYGSRHEIVQAIQSIATAATQNPSLTIDENLVAQQLYSGGIPDPDILIRTGGDSRISNFLLWQLAYSELFFMDTLWPDFKREDLIHCLNSFQQRDRRFGGLNT